MTTEDRCTGKCCQAFVLGGLSRHEIQRRYDDALRMETEGMWEWQKPHEHWTPKSLVLGITEWWPWLSYIGTFAHHPVTGVVNPDGKPKDFFKCSKLAENGDCTVYNNRPHFCESYGVTVACEHPDCRWKGAWKLGQRKPRLNHPQFDLSKELKDLVGKNRKKNLGLVQG